MPDGNVKILLCKNSLIQSPKFESERMSKQKIINSCHERSRTEFKILVKLYHICKKVYVYLFVLTVCMYDCMYFCMLLEERKEPATLNTHNI